LEPLEALTYLIANLLLLPGLWPIVPLMSVAWSLSYEVFFYVTTALAVSKLHLDQWSRKTRVAMIIMLGMALTILGVIVEFGCISIGSDELHCIRVPIRMLPFFAGMLLAEAEAAHFKAAPALLALTMPVVAFLIDATTNLPGIINEWMHTVAFLFLCSACFRGENRAATVFAWTPLRWVGNMSYSFYLIHGLALLPGFALIATLGASASMPAIFWGTMPILYAGAAVASFILFVMIERPYSFRPQRAIAARSWRSADSSLRP
jgi:peptidoglycan/LPS O-acetylase OafA/YrhL